MRLAPFLATLALLATTAYITPAAAALAHVSIHDRHDGRELPIHWHNGRRYVVGEPGRQYEIRVRNSSGGRVLAVTSVDGVNVLSGETASGEQSGYVIAPYDHVRIDGWRKSLADVAAFYFTPLPDSYAARTGRPNDVGVIGVALFREKPAYVAPPPPPVCCSPWRRGLDDASPSRDAAASGAMREEIAPAPSPQGKRAADQRIGTGHGERIDSAATRVAFERATDAPDEVIAIWYDTRANLVAQGVLPKPPRPPRAPRAADPFPGGFVPDP